MEFQRILSPNRWPGRAGHTPRWIILHGTAGFTTAEECAAYFGSTRAQSSAHYVIGRDGKVIQCADEADAAWANGGVTGFPASLGVREVGDGMHRDSWWDATGNPNNVTISIEHVKPNTDNSDRLTDAQKAASFALVGEICDRWGISKRAADAQGGVTGHFSMDPVNRSHCPGPYPWCELWNYLDSSQGGQNMLQVADPFAAAYFAEVAGASPPRWHCKATGCDIVGAILAYWRSSGGILRLPVSSEIYTGIPGGSFQIFEGGVLAWDPKRALDNPLTAKGDVYAMHIDKDTPGLRQLLARAGLAPAPNATQIDAAATTISAAIAGLQSALTDLHSVPAK